MSDQSSTASTPERYRLGTPPFHPINDDLRVRFGRTRKEYEEMHRVLTTALNTNDDLTFEAFDRRWDELLNVMDDRDYWEARCLHYHARYLAEASRAREYKQLGKVFRGENDRLRARIKDQAREISRLRAEVEDRAESDAVMDVERELLQDLESVLAADELRQTPLFEGESEM